MRTSLFRDTLCLKRDIRILAALLLHALVFTALTGCGGESSPAQTASTASSSVSVAEKPIPAPKPNPGQPVAEEQASPYGAGSRSSQSVGAIVDGMQLANVRWADHDTYFRVVFDLATPEGEPVLQVPHAETMLTPDGRVLKITISGIRSIDSNANANATDLAVSSSLVTSIKRIPSMDDQALIYEINLQQPTTYALAGLGSPGRIVIDIMKP